MCLLLADLKHSISVDDMLSSKKIIFNKPLVLALPSSLDGFDHAFVLHEEN